MSNYLWATVRHPVEIVRVSIGIHQLGGYTWRASWEIACIGQLYVELLAKEWRGT